MVKYLQKPKKSTIIPKNDVNIQCEVNIQGEVNCIRIKYIYQLPHKKVKIQSN